ncbi:MAG: hypothetical protein NTU53_18380 [Planctomycetota bacterium]|nr:hypothetical protein [Planctomycetota bacterium]
MRETTRACVILASMLSACDLASIAAATTLETATVTLDPSKKHQTIRGWSCNPFYLEGGKEQREQVIDETVNSLGINRLRAQEPGGNRANSKRWEVLNDNDDPDVTDFSKLNTAEADKFAEGYLLPFKRRVEANGEPFELWLSPSFFDGGSTGGVPAFLLQSPGEYAEHAISFITYLRDRYGIQTNHYVICNEAGNNNAFRPQVVIEMTKVLGERMAKLGLPTRGQFSDGVNAGVTWNYIQAAKDDPEVWKYVSVLSYHWYGGNNQEAMAKIRQFAEAKGLETAQTEYMGLTMNHLYDDLTIGGVSYWCIYGLGGPGPGGHNFTFHLNNTSFSRGGQFWNFRQVMHYVRPGAERIAASSDTVAVRALAFVKDGRTTVVLINNTPLRQARTVAVKRLPPGDYGVCRCVGGRPYEELGVRTVGADGAVNIDIPADSVLTIYPYLARNLPPTAVEWKAEPSFLKTPASRIKLSASAQDPELDRLTYSWSVRKQPPGASAMLANPQTASAEASGLSIPGQYTFTVAIRDGVNEVKRDVLLNVYSGNQPPMLIDVHNRLPVLVTLPQSTTELRGGALDLEGDKLSFRWSVISQPAGSAVVLETPDSGKCRVSNISTAGDHLFRFEANDGTHTVSENLTVPVYPVNSAPVIESVRAVPASLTLPESTAALSARTSDPDGDTISHWWRVKSCPAGAKVWFDKQGGRNTSVSELTVAGKYVFELTVVDRTRFTTREVVVAVQAREGGQ